MSDPIPTKDQQTKFAIAMLANFGQQYSNANPGAAGTPVKSTLNDITTRVAGLEPTIGTWKVVFGPAIYSHDASGAADNLAYVVQQPNTNNYIVGIAGTNFSGGLSSYDFLSEDLGVLVVVPWVLGLPIPVGATISSGTLLGLANLLYTPASEGTPNAGVKLVDFLTAESKKGALNVSVTGHSLGGALAPTLALFLENTKIGWDKSGRSKVTTMHVAGPTPGNDVFADLVNKTLSPEGFYNHLDVVPHVWAAKNLDELAGLYGDTDVLGAIITGIAVGLIKPLIQDFRYTPTARLELNANGKPQSGMTYMQQAAYQHIYAYDALFQLDPSQAALLHPPQKQPSSFQITQTLADAVTKAGHTLPSDVQVVPPPATQAVTVGKTTFQVRASANVDQIRQALTAIAPYFGGALG